MELLYTIKVKDLRFFSYHGFYPEEQILGHEYRVSIEVGIPLFESLGDDLANTLNYEDLYGIAQLEMAVPQKLLETVAKNILIKTRLKGEHASHIMVSICKINPPFGGDLAKSEIILNWKSND